MNRGDSKTQDVCLTQIVDAIENPQGNVFPREVRRFEMALRSGLICGIMSKRVGLHLLH